MGKYNSSETRVKPAFERILAKYKTDCSWLSKLLRLPAGGNPVMLRPDCDFTVRNCLFAPSERKLDPPVALLSWLIRHPQNLKASKEAFSSGMNPKREALLKEDYDSMMEALSLLRNDPKGTEKKNWYIFEGKTQPDVFIETPTLIVVIEGKRTEPEPTTYTTWMPRRHQMIRHLDGAWEIRGAKQVIGFFIVSGDGDTEEVPVRWREFARDTISAEAIYSSLPHRGPEEQNEIASCFAGVTTWQRLCREFGIDPKELPDKVLQ